MKISKFLIFALSVALFPSLALAQISDFGGSGVRYKGKGDLEPPRCSFDVPTIANSAFFVTWNCTDSDSDPSEIRSELWIIRSADTRPRLIGTFLGFPASVQIDEALLGNSIFTEGLPISLRLIARDRAGNAALSPVRTVIAGNPDSIGDDDDDNDDNNSSSPTCSLTLVTEGTESTETTTGMPSMTVSVIDASVSNLDTGEDSFSISTLTDATASVCEIDDVCSNSEQVSINAAFTFSGDGSLEGNVSVFPGDVSASLSGAGTLDSSGSSAEVSSFSATGSTTIDSTNTDVTLSCASLN